MTSNLCKLMERMVNNRLRWFLESNNIYTCNQSGFRKNRNCTDQLVRLENEIRKAKLNNSILGAIFVDFEKAFDMLWRDGLLFKFKKINVQGKMYLWIKSFLSNRTMQVRIGNIFSSILSIENGTPQGSVISPTLFSVAINDISAVLKTSQISQFADDSTIWSVSKSVKVLCKYLTIDISNIKKWCETWGFRISPTKTVAVIFTKNKPCNALIKMHDTVINIVNKTKFLGLLFDSKLKWNAHIDYIIERVTKRMNMMRHLSGSTWGADRYTLLILYKTLILSIIDYGSEAYNSAGKTILSKLDTLQSKCLKICLKGVHGTPNTSLQVESGQPPLQIHRNGVILKYHLKIQGIKAKHPTYSSYKEDAIYQFNLCKLDTNYKSYCFTINTLLTKYDLNSVKTHSVEFIGMEPWLTYRPNISVEIHKNFKKSDNLDVVACRDAINDVLITKYNEHLHIYTDGSKDPITNKVGCGIVIPSVNQCFSYRLSDYISIMSAELTAILLTFRIIKINQFKKSVVFVDSLSALQAIMSSFFKIENPIVLDIIRIYTELLNKNVVVDLEWIPSHIGVEGNDKADREAKAALAHLPVDINIPLIKSEIKTLLDIKIIEDWQNWYNGSVTGKFTKNIQPIVHLKPKKVKGNKQIVDTYTRLRMGYTRLAGHLYKLNRHPDGKCQECQVLETVEHYVLKCVRFDLQRSILFHTLELNIDTANMENLFRKDDKTVAAMLNFIKTTGMTGIL